MAFAKQTGIILSQGRIADRTYGAIPGAKAVAQVLSEACRLPVSSIGQPEPAAHDNWDAALAGARETLRSLADAVSAELSAGRRALVIANTCSASLATLPAAARLAGDLTVLWIDAHGDFHTPDTTESGYLGGMALAGACGLWDSGHGGGVAPRRVIQIGVRDIDPPEQALLDKSGVRMLRPEEATPEAVLALIGSGPIWVHIDWDVMEPELIPAAYSVPGGLSASQLRGILAALPLSRIAGVELAELELPEDPAAAIHATDLIRDIVAPLLETDLPR